MNPRIYKVIEELHRTYKAGPTFKNVCEFTAAVRTRKLIIEPDTMPLWLTGYCIPLADVDLVCYRERGDHRMNLPPQLHELSHLLLGHLDKPDVDDMPTYAAFIKERTILRSRLGEVSPRDPRVNEPKELANLLVGAIQCRSMGFDEPKERDAETLATLLLGTILRSETSMPLVARELYGA
jgi:hypothetical protein